MPPPRQAELYLPYGKVVVGVENAQMGWFNANLAPGARRTHPGMVRDRGGGEEGKLPAVLVASVGGVAADTRKRWKAKENKWNHRCWG